MTPSSVTVVGSSGTLGARLATRLGARPVDLRGTDPRDTAPVPAIAEARVVVNAGGPRVRPGLDWEDYAREHVGLAARVVRSMRAGSRLVHLGSTAVYGARGCMLDAGAPEAPECFPMPAYACAKMAAE